LVNRCYDALDELVLILVGRESQDFAALGFEPAVAGLVIIDLVLEGVAVTV
jgi:hypothetical protein